MKKFEYLRTGTDSLSDEYLNSFGKEGWELVGFETRWISDHTSYTFIFKREKQEESKGFQKTWPEES